MDKDCHNSPYTKKPQASENDFYTNGLLAAEIVWPLLAIAVGGFGFYYIS